MNTFKAAILFSPEIGLLLVNNLLYYLNRSGQVSKLVSNQIPNLPSEYQNSDEQPICKFSYCENYVAIASSFSQDDDPKSGTLNVYRVFFPDGEISRLDVSLRKLEILTGIEIAKMKIDFHPHQPKLGVLYWAKVAEMLEIRCLVLDLRTMGLEYVQSPHEDTRKQNCSVHSENVMYQ